MKLTKKICDETITLPIGHYLACSPIGTTLVQVEDDKGTIVWKKDLREYEKRCLFLNAFNNGEMSFYGRYWE